MKKRSAQWFVNAVKKSVARDPAAPVRFDTEDADEYNNAKRAFRILEASCPQWGITLGSRYPQNREIWEMTIKRVAFLGPECPKPKDDIERAHACYSQDEIMQLFFGNVSELRWILPDVKRGRKQLETCRNNARPAGKKRAHYTHKQITFAFQRFKRDNQTKTVWDAAAALIRPGKELDHYRTVDGLWKIVGSIAKGLGITREEWYGDI